MLVQHLKFQSSDLGNQLGRQLRFHVQHYKELGEYEYKRKFLCGNELHRDIHTLGKEHCYKPDEVAGSHILGEVGSCKRGLYKERYGKFERLERYDTVDECPVENKRDDRF